MTTPLRLYSPLLFDMLEKHLAPLGFRLNRGDRSYSRRIQGGRQWIQVFCTPIDSNSYFSVACGVSVRIDAIEELLVWRRGALSKRDLKTTASVGAEVGNIAGTGYSMWSVEVEEDVPVVAKQVLAALNEVGFDYLESMSTIEGILAVASNDGEFSERRITRPAVRGLLALACLRLLGRDAEIPAMIERKREFLTGRYPKLLPEFDGYVDKFLSTQ